MNTFIQKIGLIHNNATSDPNLVLTRILTITREMMSDRGFNVKDVPHNMAELVHRITKSEPIMTCTRKSVKTYVFFHNEDRIGVKQLRNWIEAHKNTRFIIASLEGPTTFAKKEIENSDKHMQFFTFKELSINPTKHTLVPKHTKVKKEDVPYKVSQQGHEWPKLSLSDVIAKYYDYEVGDLIKIRRTFAVQQPVYYYRMVSVI